MKVYLITAFCVFCFSYLSQYVDYNNSEIIKEGYAKHKRQALFFFLVSSLVMIYVAGKRYFVGTDFSAYYLNYKFMANEVWDRFIKLDEPGFGVLSKLVIFFGGNGSDAIFWSSFFTIGLSLFVIFRYTDKQFYGSILFLFIGCWLFSFNAVRQCMAAACLLMGYGALRDKKIYKYFFFVVLAFLFHRSAILMAIPYFIIHWKVNIKSISLLSIGTAIVLYSYNLLFNFTENVLNKDLAGDLDYFNTSVNIFRILVGCAPAIYFIWKNWNKDNDSIIDFHLNILLLHAIINVVTMNSAYLARMVIYSESFAVISISELSKTIERKNRKMIMALIIVAYFAFWLYEINNSKTLRIFQWV